MADRVIEIKLRKALWHKGYRYRKNYKKLPGSPDIVLTKYHIAIFCDSELFHGKDYDQLEKKLKQSNNSEFWINKIERNINRDEKADKQLNELGYRTIHFWGNDIKEDVCGCVEIIEEAIMDYELLKIQ